MLFCRTLVNNVIGGHDGETTPIAKIYNDSAVNRFGDAYAKAHPQMITNMVLGPGAAQYYIFANHSVVTSLIRDIKLKPQVAETLLDKRFNKRAKLLNQLLDENIRKKVRVRTFAGIKAQNVGDEGRDYLAMTPEEDYALKLHATMNGLISFPTLSDKKTYYFLDGFNVLQVTIEVYNGVASSAIRR